MSGISSRFWRFALVNLVGIIMVAAAIAALYRYVAVESFKEMRAQQNFELAVALSNTLVDEITELREVVESRSPFELKTSTEIDRFAALIDIELDLLPVYTVNIFTPDGLILYSTNRQTIGAKMLMNDGVDAAATGNPISALVRRDTFNEYDRIVENRDMVETYLPLRNEAGQVIGIFEIHADISDFFARVDGTQRTVTIGVAVALLSLYLLLMVTFWRSDRRLFMGVSLPGRYRSGNVAQVADDAKAEFVATISHELRTPLNAVLGMTDLLNLTSLTRKQREYIQTIQSSGDMLISLVDNLLDFAHMENSGVELKDLEFDVIDLLERVMRMMGHSASSKGIELVADIRHNVDLRIVADKQRLRQILVNVIGNAIKFTETGEVVVTSDAAKNEDGTLELSFTVTDTGCGIDDEDRERLFAAFVSGARPASTQAQGSGLGLAISKKLLDAMSGTIDLRSRDSGGTVVSIKMPVKQARSSATDDLVTSRDGWPERVLSLHHNRSAAQSICTLLSKLDILCETVYDVEDGMHRLLVAASVGKPFDCVIIDSSLTPADRLLTARRMRTTATTADIPIVLLTSISEPLSVGEVSALGGIRCINKPVLPLELRYNLLRSVQADAPMTPAPQPSSDGDPQIRELRILIAEDNPVSSGVLQSMLRTAGYGADVVDNGPAVLEELENRQYDLLLLDCQLPVMDGDVVTQKIREAPERYSGEPVIVAVTADVTETHRAQCLAAGMDDFMPKPVRLDRLRAGLQRWIAMLDERDARDKEAASVDLRQSIAERAGQDDESFLRNYIDIFLADTESRLSEMSRAFVFGDTETVRRQGHALKGSCLELGADRMVRFCEDLSIAARHDNLDEVGAVIGRLDREFARLRPFYESAQVSSTSPN
jgi:signal transduction histidine kinase/DNA-binding response OmpR family regulator